MATVEITNLTRRPVPRFAYSAVSDAVLPDWDISLVFVGPEKAKELNMQLRKKSYVPNVLSYEAGNGNGEIFICPEEAEKQAPDHKMSTRTFILFLFIHGLLHLKGLPHGATMERCERTLLARFSKTTPRTSRHAASDSDRHRHRHLPGEGSGRRRTRR